ncbi:hypothetical protein L1887_45166 [Cichorium endivia]|nr:hypothetical protein L1887_45166 [Cichorium endivia]
METRRDDRIAQLLQALKRSDKLHLKEAANLLGVSEMTIRRDLNSESAPVVLLGGYIVLEPRSASHYLISDQKTRLVEEKRKAARLAASLVQPHQTLFFDCGTTTPWIIEAIDSSIPFTAVCYSLNTFLALQEKPECRVILCGGEFHASNAIFKPLNLQDTLSNLSARISLSCAGGRSQQVWQGAFGKMGELAQFDAIVSDCRPDDEIVAHAKAQQVKLMY